MDSLEMHIRLYSDTTIVADGKHVVRELSTFENFESDNSVQTRRQQLLSRHALYFTFDRYDSNATVDRKL